MSVQFSKAAVIEKNRTAIQACNQSIERIKILREGGLFPDDQTDLIIQHSRAINERKHLRQVNAHLKAAGTTVRPMANNVADELNDLGNRLDQQIRNDLIINATIDFITSVLDDASRLRAITDAHKA
jgi:hypothetical protein